MSDLTVIILTYNEKLHISRCLSSLKGLGARVLVIDSFSTDNTCEIVTQLGAEIVQHAFVNQAQQFQWAMNNCNIATEWVMRLDADEIIDTTLVENLVSFIDLYEKNLNGAIFHRKHIFLGKWIRFGGRCPLPMLRLFRRGCGHIEQRWMDEHIVLDEGQAKVLDGSFEDHNLHSISWFIDKHNKYATREVVDIMLKNLNGDLDSWISENTGFAVRVKRILKQKVYMNLPYFFRPTIYFLFRYFIQLGFLDGCRGFAYHFMQCFWYRALVDLKCLEIDRAWRDCNSYNEKFDVLEMVSGYDLSEYRANEHF